MIDDKKETQGIRINRQRLTPNEKNYAELLFIGDIHYGHYGCDIKRVEKQINYCVENNIYVVGMGDYIEAGLINSIGDSVYTQQYNPQKQMDYIVELFTPLAKKGLLLGLLMGNHEGRILKNTSINIVKIISDTIKVPYLGYACWNLFYVGKESYSIYSLHGASGSRYIHTKLKALTDISHSFDADIIAMGHCHSLGDCSLLVQKINRKRKIVEERKKFLVLTGSYMKYDDSYAQEKGMPLSKLGSPKIKLFSNKKDIHLSV